MLGDAKVDEHGNVNDTKDCNVMYLDKEGEDREINVSFLLYLYIYIYIYSVCVYRGSMRILKSFIQWLYFMFIID